MKRVSDSRCPRCAAVVRPDARWCSLCHHALGEDPRGVSVSAAPIEAAAEGPDSSAPATVPSARGRHARGRQQPADVMTAREPSASDLDIAALALLGDIDLGEAHDGQLDMFGETLDINRIDLSALADRPVVSGRLNELASRLDSNGAKVGVMVGIAVGMSVLIFGFLTLVGILFT